jgi:hypothetical protein
MDFYLVLILILFACSPLLLFYIIKPRSRVNSYVIFNIKNRSNGNRQIDEQFEKVEQIMKDDDLTIDFSGYFRYIDEQR